MANKRIVILGAGLCGLSAAWHLQKKDIDCCVFEKESEVGGLCRSKNIGGFTFDYDGHVLHFRHAYTFNLARSLLGSNLVKHERSAWVYSYGTYIRYPFQANLYGLSPSIIKECLLGFIEARRSALLQNKKTLNFLEWIYKTFGSGIARHFMVPYNTKFWTVPPQELTCEWLDGFIPVPELDELIDGTVRKSKRQLGYNAQFWYPKKGGISELPLALASRVKNVYTDCPVTKIDIEKKTIIIGSSNEEKFDYLISTIPLPEMPSLVKRMPAPIRTCCRKLRWNSIFNLNLGLKTNNYDTKHWVYFPGQEVNFFRIGFFRNFSATLTPQGKDSLYIEVAYAPEKNLDKDRLTLDIKKDLKKVEILKDEDKIIIEDINDIKYAYPICNRYYSRVRHDIIKYLTNHAVIPAGRYGSWRYMSMEDVILDGTRVAESLSKNV